VPLARDVILEFLTDHPAPICAPCLSKRTKLSPTRLLDGWRDLVVLRSDYGARRGRCGDCAEVTELLSRIA